MRIKVLAVAAAVLLLAGCSRPFGGANADELLRAPQPNATQSAVQKALSTYLGGTMQLKYPRGGTEMSPMLLADLDNDGTQEAAVLFTAEGGGQEVRLALLESTESGWQVAWEAKGLSTEVACVQTAQLVPGATQLLVGYASTTLTDHYLAVYDYRDGTLTRMCEQAYTEYLVADFERKGTQSLVMVQPSAQPGALTLQYYAAQDTTLQNKQSILLDERFVACKGLYSSVWGRKSGLVIDGSFSTGGLSSEVFLLQDGVFSPATGVPEDLPAQTQRYTGTLLATKFLPGAAVEVPCEVTPAPLLSSARRFSFITWRNYLKDAAELAEDAQLSRERFGVYDSTYGYFLQLPQAWQGKIQLADGKSAGDWQVRSRETGAMLLSVRVADSTRPLGAYTRVAIVGEKQILLYTGGECTPQEAGLIRRGVTVME